MRRDIVSNTSKHLKEQMTRTLDAMSGLGPNPNAFDPKDMASFGDYLYSLPPEERYAIIAEMAASAGHRDGETTPCPMCRFIELQQVRGVNLGG